MEKEKSRQELQQKLQRTATCQHTHRFMLSQMSYTAPAPGMVLCTAGCLLISISNKDSPTDMLMDQCGLIMPLLRVPSQVTLGCAKCTEPHGYSAFYRNGCQGSKFRPSCFHDQHFTHCAVSTAPRPCSQKRKLKFKEWRKV